MNAPTQTDDLPVASDNSRNHRPLRARLLRLLPVIVIAALPPLIFNDYWLWIAAQVVVYAIATQGLDILYGRTGQMSLAHASFMGVGAYTGYILASRGQGVAVQLLSVLLVSLLAGLVVGIPTLRLSGLRLALVTLAFGQLFAWLLTNTVSLTGGTQGTPVDPIVIGPLDSSVPLQAYVIVIVPALIATLIVLHLGRTQLGRRMLIVRDSETAAQSVGVAVSQTKVVAFLVSAAFAGVAGWLFAGVTGFISPTDFNLFASIYLFVAVVIGGAGSPVGAWLGAAYIVLMPQAFNLVNQPNLYPLVGGALLTVVALLVPDGIVGLGKRLARLARRGNGQLDAGVVS